MTNGKPAVLLVVRKSPDANIIDTVDRIRAEMPELHEVIRRLSTCKSPRPFAHHPRLAA